MNTLVPAPTTVTRMTPTQKRKTATYRNIGEPAAQPCVHALATWDEIDDPAGTTRTLTRRTINHCGLTGGHDKAENTPHSSGNLTW